MNILLDTHSLIWYLDGNRNLSKNALEKIENIENDIYISIASLWEIAIKIRLNKLTLNIPLTELKTLLNEKSIKILSIVFEDILIISTLENNHNDPFDRIIIAQSINNHFPIITYDNTFQGYGVEIIS